MLDLREIRADPDRARSALARRGVPPGTVDELLQLDGRRRELLPELEGIRKDKNEASKRIGELQRRGEDTAEAIAEVRAVGGREKELQAELTAVEERRDAQMVGLPNLPDETAPDQEQVLREVGQAGASGRDHLELLGDLIDLEAGARVAGSRFAYLTNAFE